MFENGKYLQQKSEFRVRENVRSPGFETDLTNFVDEQRQRISGIRCYFLVSKTTRLIDILAFHG